MALTRAERKAAGQVNGRGHLAAAPIGTETTIPCPSERGCGTTLVVRMGRAGSDLEKVRALACPSLGCRHQEQIAAAVEVSLAGGAALPGLEEGNGAMATTADQAAAGPTPATTAAPAADSGKRSPRNTRTSRESLGIPGQETRGDRKRRAEREARLLKRAEEGATVPVDPSFGAAELEPGATTIVVGETAGFAGAFHLDGERTDGEALSLVMHGERAAGDDRAEAWTPLATDVLHDVGPRLLVLDISDVAPHPLNPRKRFDEESLGELAESIKEHGLLQPIVVRSAGAVPAGVARWWIVAGERRWRAAKLAGLARVPAIERIVADDAQHVRLALLENLARADLDPIEEARGYQQLRDLAGMKAGEIGEAIGRSRATIANAVRLLDLPADVLDLVSAGKLGATHARALLKYAAWPKTVSKIAELAAAAGTTSKDLEGSLQFTPELKSRRLIAEIPSGYAFTQNPTFDKAVCKACPFNARAAGGWSGAEWCLQPAHMAQLKREWREQQAKAAEAAKAAFQAAREANAGQTVAVTEGQAVAGEMAILPTAEGSAPVPVAPLLDLTTAKAGADYVVVTLRPAGCSAETCACAARARVKRWGSLETADVCLDPPRLASLQDAERAAAEAERQRRTVAALALLDGRLDGVTAAGRDGLVALVASLVLDIQYHERDGVLAMLGERWPLLREWIPREWGGTRPVYGERLAEALSALSADELLRLALDVQLRPMLTDLAAQGSARDGQHGLLGWFLPGLLPAVAEAGSEAAEAESASEGPPFFAAALEMLLGVPMAGVDLAGLVYPKTASLKCVACGGSIRIASELALRETAEEMAAAVAADTEVSVFCSRCQGDAAIGDDLPPRTARAARAAVPVRPDRRASADAVAVEA